MDAHGSSETSGWVTLRWFADSVHSRPEVVGPYSSYDQAVAAMQDSLLIDGFAEDTNRSEVLDDVHVATGEVSIARMCADYGHRVTLIDPGDPSHFGEPHAEPTASAPTAYSGLLQAGALHPPGPDESRPDAEGVAEPVDRSPGPPGR